MNVLFILLKIYRKMVLTTTTTKGKFSNKLISKLGENIID